MSNQQQLISDFVKSLEAHPKGVEIIEIIEKILSNDSGVVHPQLITTLRQLSNNNMSLLIDLWILRGSIFKEEEREKESLRTFYEAGQWRPTDASTWIRIADIYKNQNELIKAFFFLAKGQKCLNSTDIVNYELEAILNQLERNLALPPGIIGINLVKT